jgi:outer membrane protein assembly factor BamE (lipoprotein component of BamABCDE complex)
MRSNRILPILVFVALIFAAASGCSRGPSEEELKQAEFLESFATLQQEYDSTTQNRAELAAARASIAEIEAVAEGKRSDEQKAALEELTARSEELSAKQEAEYEELQTQLADLLTIGLNDYPTAPETAQALEIYCEEAVLVADDMIAKAGEYQKAMEKLGSAANLYEQAGLKTHQPLLDKIKEYDDWRFITKERFDSVKNGMTKDEIRIAVGVPYYQNIQLDEKRGVETWLYKKREGGVAAIYFKTKNDKVYSKNFDAVKMQVVE